MTAETDVLVVGAGPVGLMLAGELRLGGASVTVAEQLAAPMTESRASTLHSRTMEIFDCRGLLDALGTARGHAIGHFGGVPLDLTLPGPYPGQWKVPQARTEALLQRWATALGARIRRGVRVDGLTEHAEHVEASVTGPDGRARLRARYLVGCDGEQSTVRRLAGFAFPRTPARKEMLRADIRGVEIPDRRFQRLPGGLAIASRGPDGVTRVMVHAHGTPPLADGAAPAFSDVVTAWKKVTGEDIGDGTPLWVNAFTDVSGQAGQYRSGRVLLAGDAAHVQMPVGGQALNLGLADAVNLGWKLALVTRGRAGGPLLDTYHAERHAAGARVLANIRAQALLLLSDPDADAVREVLRELIQISSVRTRLAGMISGAGIRYDVGPGSHPLLGAPAPVDSVLRAGSGTTTLAAQLRTGRGVLLVPSAGPGPGPGPLVSQARGWADRVDVVAGSALSPSGDGDAFQAGEAALIRPDGYVAWADPGPAGLSTALRRWFGPPLAVTSRAPGKAGVSG